MRIWIVNIGRVSKTFQTEESFNSWISDIGYDTTDADSKAVVTIYEANPIETKTVKEIKDSIKESNIRESRIQAVVSDDPWFSKYENFKNGLSKYSNTQPMIEKLSMFSDKKSISKYLKSNKEFLLCDISDDVEWFELVIDFVGVKEMVDGSYKKMNGYNTKVIVSKKRKDNFLKAKENVS